MDINKVNLLLKYILAAAGQEDCGNRKLGNSDPGHEILFR